MSKRSKLTGTEDVQPKVTITVDGQLYLLDEVKAVAKPFDGGEEMFFPATCLGPNFDISGCENDDGSSKSFLQVLLVQRDQGNPPNLGQRRVLYLPEGVSIRKGPYVFQSTTGCIFSVLKLYEDSNNTFVGGVLPDGPLRYKWLEGFNRIPVPSRLYDAEPTAELPLAGMRFGVKDAIDIAGLETGNGSRCYRELHPVRNLTSACIARLIGAGATLVGKMRLCQWCDGQDPMERLEEVTPTNPRGDTFQKPSASSSGSAAGCASYPWLDFTVGTDTGGSIRHPAGVNGLYGLRPSIDLIKSSGLVCTALMDTPGVFARSAKVAEKVMKAMLTEAEKPQVNSQVTAGFRILYAVEPESAQPSETPNFFSSGGRGQEARTPAGKLFEDFMRSLERSLGCKREEICIYDLWRETHPRNTPEDLLEATDSIYKNIVYGQLSRDVVQPFVREYQARYGRPPFIEANTKARLDYGAAISNEELDKSINAFEQFADWVNDVLLPRPSTEGGEIPLLVYPQSWGRPQYRDDLPKLKTQQVFWSGFSVYSISYCSGCPDFTVPIGEVPFRSKFTERNEYLPVALSLLVPRNMDTSLLDLIKRLEKEGILNPVKCGSRLY
ncbi:amidase signature domain-containing protein [Hypoxylon sp. FL1284]|nr:amidase signature domain-containing protein [Hypoxylon sp. FL1284]